MKEVGMRLTRAQMQEDIDFLVHRATATGKVSFGDDGRRFTGASSNDLVRLAYTGECQGILPSDYSDAGACARTWAMLPAHRQTVAVHRRLIEGIEKVRSKYPGETAHNPETATAIAKVEAP